MYIKLNKNLINISNWLQYNLMDFRVDIDKMLHFFTINEQFLNYR